MDCLRSLGRTEQGFDTRANDNADMAWKFAVAMLRDLSIRELGIIGQPPYNFFPMHTDDLDAALKGRDAVIKEHQFLIEAENRLSLSHCPECQRLLSDLCWEEMHIMRLMFAVVKREKYTCPDSIGPDTLHMLDGLFCKMPDEKGAEDLHQRGRDIARQQRWTSVAMPSLFDEVIESDVLN